MPVLPTQKKARCAFSLEDRATNSVEPLYPESGRRDTWRGMSRRRYSLRRIDDKAAQRFDLPSIRLRKSNVIIYIMH